jgi:hypothetical protein
MTTYNINYRSVNKIYQEFLTWVVQHSREILVPRGDMFEGSVGEVLSFLLRNSGKKKLMSSDMYYPNSCNYVSHTIGIGYLTDVFGKINKINLKFQGNMINL